MKADERTVLGRRLSPDLLWAVDSIIGQTQATNREYGFSVCADETGVLQPGEDLCQGSECSLTLGTEDCRDRRLVGVFHTHPAAHEAYPSMGDTLGFLQGLTEERDYIACMIAGNPIRELTPLAVHPTGNSRKRGSFSAKVSPPDGQHEMCCLAGPEGQDAIGELQKYAGLTLEKYQRGFPVPQADGRYEPGMKDIRSERVVLRGASFADSSEARAWEDESNRKDWIGAQAMNTAADKAWKMFLEAGVTAEGVEAVAGALRVGPDAKDWPGSFFAALREVSGGLEVVVDLIGKTVIPYSLDTLEAAAQACRGSGPPVSSGRNRYLASIPSFINSLLSNIAEQIRETALAYQKWGMWDSLSNCLKGEECDTAWQTVGFLARMASPEGVAMDKNRVVAFNSDNLDWLRGQKVSI